MIHRVKDSDIFLSYSSEGKTTDVTVYYGVNTSIEKYENDLIAMKAPTKSRIGLLVQDMNGISVYNTDADLVKVDLKLNYGDDFIEKDKRIKEYLRGDKSGLILLHSVPGAGKSTYIQHLCNCVDKRFIFIPSNMAFNLASPSFIRILIDNKDCDCDSFRHTVTVGAELFLNIDGKGMDGLG